ncbi:hypothetical protein AA2016_4759 [Aminobacter aminovorans]|uniref:Uncharacterized protein n=2 Tax=Aminobacter aminovorans TaxID=83263 RepID=A0AAC8YT91_AMIAI|nr:hypothetical protein AA2016_4759 [Aminobacter aminovorans]
MPKNMAIKSPESHANSLAYDAECQSALTNRLESLLDDAQAAGWDRTKAAAALMYLSAKRLRSSAD